MRANLPPPEYKRVVIVGGGFGGLKLAQKLKGSRYQVVLLDKNNFHTFQPLLYQVAIGGLEPDSIAYPLRKIFSRQRNFHFRVAEVLSVNDDKKLLETSVGIIYYDYLVIATGSKTNFFGIEDIMENGMAIKSVPEALDLRSLIIQNFERALLLDEGPEKDALLNIVVVGGGPTGLETSGSLSELKRHVFPHDYPELNLDKMMIHMIESGDRLLGAMSEKSSAAAEKYIRGMGVHVLLNTRVLNYDGTTVKLNTGETIAAKTLIWSAGVTGNILNGVDAGSIHKGRIAVDSYNRMKGSEHIFCIGDAASLIDSAYPTGYPMLAPIAIQQGTQLAKNLLRISSGETLKPFSYFDKGTMATVGRNKALIDAKGFHIHGFIAWIGWLFIHLMYLVGFRNRIIVFINWLWSYVNYDSAMRLVIRPFKRKNNSA